MAEPNVVELRIFQDRREGGGEPPGSPGGPPPGGAGPEDELPPVHASDDALAARLIGVMGQDWRFAAGDWYRWDGRRWEREQTKLAWKLARDVCREIANGIPNVNLGRKVSSRNTVYAAVSLAETDRRVAMMMSDFDRDAWRLNTPDGIVELKSGQLEPHDRLQLMTKIAGAGPIAAGDCPTFKRYLEESTGGDEALQKYLQRVAGYCLTGSIEEHCILFFYGPGGSGKSTFLLVLQDLLGDYAVNAAMQTFVVSQGQRHETELAHLCAARVVTASEIETGMRWDEAKLKAISGGDKITARYMRGDFFTFEPQFKLILAGNHRPRMRSADDAMRRRMQVVPFTHKPLTVDKQLREKLRGELGAILRWAIEGEAERRRLGGLNPPRAVIDATNEYFKQENTIGRWIDERCEVGLTFKAGTRELCQDYNAWALSVREYPISEREFSGRLEQVSGIEKDKDHSVRAGFRGLRLKFATPELPGVDEPPRLPHGVVPVNAVPLEPIDDPADDSER